MALIDPKNDIAGSVSLSRLALQIAQSQLGVSEQPIGSNAGPKIAEYLIAVGLSPGYPWCQAFVYWCYKQAAAQLSRENPVVRTPGVIACWNRTAVQDKITVADAIKSPAVLEPGTQFILNYGKGQGHTGMIERVEGQLIYTIEGNSNSNGSREGYEVVRHKRNLTESALLGFIKY